MRNKQKIHGASAIAEISCSGILLISMLLPWVSIRLGGSGTFGLSTSQDLSFFDGIDKLSSIGGFAANITSSSNYAFLLYLIPLLCVINILVQCFTRLPSLSFYTTIIPIITAVVVCYGCIEASELGNYSSFGEVTIGVGTILTILSGSVILLCAWTSIGWYYKEHWIYLIVVSSWSLLSLCFPYKTFNFEYNTTTAILILCYLGCIHIPFVIYALILCLISYFTGRGREKETEDPVVTEDPSITSEETEGYMNSARMRSDEELKNILQHKDDYNPHLVNAAEKVILERITAAPLSTPITGSEPASSLLSEQTSDHERYKTEQSPSGNEQQEATPPVTPQEEAIEKEGLPLPDEMPQSETEEEAASIIEEYFPTEKPDRTKLIIILAGIIVMIGGILSYFLWYAPYAKDRDTLRTYVVANSIFLRSSEESETESNILNRIPYGSELTTYEKDSTWAKVKINGQEGFVASPYLLTSEDFSLLNNAWGDTDAKECIESSRCRLAILDFYKSKQLQSGPEGWQIFTKIEEEKPNTVFYPRIYNKDSKFTDFIFIVKSIREGGKRMLVCYSFDDETEAPIYRFCTEAPREGSIEKILPKPQKVTIIFDNHTQIKITL